MMSWSEEIVDRLAALKRAGASFEHAWSVALREVPPRGREHRGELTLLSDPRELDPVEFMRRAADDAWHGRRPCLAALTVDGLAREAAVSARMVGRSRVADMTASAS